MNVSFFSFLKVSKPQKMYVLLKYTKRAPYVRPNETGLRLQCRHTIDDPLAKILKSKLIIKEKAGDSMKSGLKNHPPYQSVREKLNSAKAPNVTYQMSN